MSVAPHANQEQLVCHVKRSHADTLQNQTSTENTAPWQFQSHTSQQQQQPYQEQQPAWKRQRRESDITSTTTDTSLWSPKALTPISPLRPQPVKSTPTCSQDDNVQVVPAKKCLVSSFPSHLLQAPPTPDRSSMLVEQDSITPAARTPEPTPLTPESDDMHMCDDDTSTPQPTPEDPYQLNLQRQFMQRWLSKPTTTAAASNGPESMQLS